MLASIDEWESFFCKYREQAAFLFEREGWELDDPRWQRCIPASTYDVDAAERRLGVVLPPSLRAFYLTCDGWPADGWMNPAINRLNELDWLESVNPSIYKRAFDAELDAWTGRPDDDPDLLSYRFEQGTSVKRSLALTFDENDQETLLLDVHANWRCGSWAHWNPAMSWSNGGFSDYMVERLDCLLGD